jgi:multisubunit Na+/H+ antiporter MnhG subunit
MEKRYKSLETALVITAGLLVLHYFTHNIWILRVATVVSLIGVLLPSMAALIHKGWMLLAQGLGWFNGRVLLSVLFFAILTPFAWLAKAFGASSMQLKKKEVGESYYIVRDHTYTKEDLENLF